MESNQSDQAPQQFLDAQELLKDTLEQACRADIYGADTGELIRIEEMLAIADSAAKQAISIRRRIRVDREHPAGASGRDRLLSSGTDPNAVGAYRRFQDAAGVAWDVRAIYPSAASGRVRLPEPFESGWLAFESPGEKRRLSPIPEGWDSRAEEALRELCRAAQLVPPRATTGEWRGEERSS